MATLDEIVRASKFFAKRTVRRDALPTLSTNGIFGRLFRRSNQDAGKKAPIKQNEIDAVEPPTDLESIHEPLIVSPSFAQEMMLDLPDQSAEDVSSIVNDLAFSDVSHSSPKAAVPGKRKRQKADAVDEYPKKRVTKGSGTGKTRDAPPLTPTNDTTGHGERSNGVALEVAKLAPGKLPRPKKERQKRHMAQIYPVVQNSVDIWDPAPSPKKQVETLAPAPTVVIRIPQSPEASPRPQGRPQGRPPRVGPSPTSQRTSVKKGQRGNMKDEREKPRHKGQQREDHKERARAPRSTRSTAAANGQKDAILNASTDLTKKPERDARRAAKQRKSLEQNSVSTSPSARETREIALRARNGESPFRARAQKADHDGHEDVSDSFEVRPRLQNQVVSEELKGGEEELERGGSEAEEEESNPEGPTQVSETGEEEVQREEEPEVFGQDGAWKTALKAARSICGRKLPLNHMPKLFTKTIRDLIHDVREARVLYEQALSFEGSGHASHDELNSQLTESIDAIEDQIRRVSEKIAATKSSEMIRDIYARAIPAMVFLIQSALASRVYHSHEPCDLETLNGIVIGLEEIIRLYHITIILCDKARSWRAKPVPTSRPIIKPTTRDILPNLRLLEVAFRKISQQQNKKRKVKQNALDTIHKEEDLVRSSQQARQEAARKNDILHRKIRESREEEDERRRNAKPTRKQIIQDDQLAKRHPQRVNNHTESGKPWSKEEDIELYYQLEKGYRPEVTTEERFLNILNAPPLQNKLPEHIRKRASYFRIFLLEERGELEWITSIPE